jgi:hypothetical protein
VASFVADRYLRITDRCGSALTSALTAASSRQELSVRNSRRSGWASNETPYAPSARRTWRWMRIASTKNGSTCRQVRSVKRDAMTTASRSLSPIFVHGSVGILFPHLSRH